MATEIDFLPAEYWKKRQSQRDQWYLLGMGLASLFPLLSSFLQESSSIARLRSELAAVESEYHEAAAEVEAVERLKTQCAPLAQDARFYALLRARPSLSRTLAAIAASCPVRVSLSTTRVRPVRTIRPDQKSPAALSRNPVPPAPGASPLDPHVEQLERFANDRELTRLSIELSGVAESDLDIAELIERLERAGCFREVNLSTVDFQSAGVVELREFKIQCRLAEVL